MNNMVHLNPADDSTAFVAILAVAALLTYIVVSYAIEYRRDRQSRAHTAEAEAALETTMEQFAQRLDWISDALLTLDARTLLIAAYLAHSDNPDQASWWRHHLAPDHVPAPSPDRATDPIGPGKQYWFVPRQELAAVQNSTAVGGPGKAGVEA